MNAFIKILTRAAIAFALLLSSAFPIDYPKYDKRLEKYPKAKSAYYDAVKTNDAQRALDLANFYIDQLKDYKSANVWFEITYEKNGKHQSRIYYCSKLLSSH